MAVAPLFIADMTTLKAQMRLTGAVTDDFNAIFTQAVREARMKIFDALGETTIATLVATALSDTPSTTAQYNRVKANTVEALICRRILIQRLPTMMMETDGLIKQVWNEEGLTRNLGGISLEKELARLDTEIGNLLEDLAGGDAGGSISVSVIEPDGEQPRPGDSIFTDPCCEAPDL